jgi:hypothetical protein
MRKPFPLSAGMAPGRRLPVVCRDRVIRTAVITGRDVFYGDVFRAAVQLTVAGKRRTVSGWFSWYPVAAQFKFFGEGVNAGLIPLTSHRPQLAAAAHRLIKATAYGYGGGHAWALPSDHAAAIAAACRKWQVTWYGTPELGWIATAEFKRIKPELLPRLALFFDKLGRFQAAAGE